VEHGMYMKHSKAEVYLMLVCICVHVQAGGGAWHVHEAL